jgi:ferrochelatase
MDPMAAPYDALLVVSFGGPEGPDEVMPFLENVLRGRNVPAARMQEVADHYHHFGGRSPINDQCRALVAAVREELDRHGPRLPVYWGNRNWRPFLPETLEEMAHDGVRRALAFVTSAFGSYSGCRQYREDLDRARAAVGPRAPEVEKLRGFHDHPGYVLPLVDRAAAALARVPAQRREAARLVFTAHSIPTSMAAASPYVAQLRETAGLVAARLGRPEWTIAYQSRSGPPGQPWLEPDILDHLRVLAESGAREVVVAPIGFVSDHMEVLYDLDVAAGACAAQLGLVLVRAATAGVHPRFVQMVRELLEERLSPDAARLHLGALGPSPDTCAHDCCPRPAFAARPVVTEVPSRG